MIISVRGFQSKSLNLMIQLLGLLCLSGQLTVAQVLKGRITDISGQPIPYATVFFQELKQGTTSNTRGDYEVKLHPGTYFVIFQSLGYEPVMETIKISDRDVTRNIVLTEQVYSIPEVRIAPSGEDPAMAIMRRVISLAPYYLNYINYYKAEVYLKGNLKMNRIPKLIQRSMRMGRSEDDVTVSAGGKPESESYIIKEGDSFLMESFNEIEFTAPDKYVQRVISFNSTFPDEGDEVSPMDYIQASFYQPVLADMVISPLSPQAFSYYNFRYIGSSFQGNYSINKIEVIPKRKSQQVLAGTIFVIEDLWCLHSVDLTNENLAGKIKVRELYIPVQEEVWMPVSHQIDIDLQIFGIRADAGYSSSVKYLDVKPNENLQKPNDISTGYAGRYVPDSSLTKTGKEINRILQKEELTNRDMVRVARLMEKESAKSRSDTISKSLEIKDNTVQIVEKDAGKKDSAFWAGIRPIPLSETEIRNLRISDSIKTERERLRRPENDTIEAINRKKTNKPGKTIKYIFLGHTWSDTTGFSFTNGGLINLRSLSFNTVDGFIYGTDFRINKRFKDQSSLGIYPDLRYAFSRERLLWRVNINYYMPGMKPKQLFLRTGMTSRDINTGSGINPLINSFTTLLMKKNYLKLYESRYLTLGFDTEILNGLNLELSAGFDNRKVLENTTSFSFSGSDLDYSDNIPDNEYLTTVTDGTYSMNDMKHLEFVTNVTFTPFRKYRIYKGNKYPEGSDWPTFIFTWKHGVDKIASVSDALIQFDRFRFEASQRIETGPFSEFKWRAGTGGITNKGNVSFFDFFHFNSQPVALLIDEYDDAFMLPAYYSLSSPEFFGEAHIKYTTPYLLIKLLPGLSKTLIRENLFFSYIGSRFHGNYFEIGYSLSEIFLFGEAGFYAGFDGFKYKTFGVRFTLHIN